MRTDTEPQGCVYCVRNRENGKAYVGKYEGRVVEKRWKKHLLLAKNGSESIFHRALRKYGDSAFNWKIVWRGPIRILNEKEIYYIGRFHSFVDDPKGGGYNLTRGGDGGKPSRQMAKKRADAIRKAWADPELRATQSEKLRTMFASDEQRAQRSKLRKLDWQKPDYRRKMSLRPGNRNKRTKAERAHLSKVVKKWWKSLSTKQKKKYNEKRCAASKQTWANKTHEERAAFREIQRNGWIKRKLKKR